MTPPTKERVEEIREMLAACTRELPKDKGVPRYGPTYEQLDAQRRLSHCSQEVVTDLLALIDAQAEAMKLAREGLGLAVQYIDRPELMEYNFSREARAEDRRIIDRALARLKELEGR